MIFRRLALLTTSLILVGSLGALDLTDDTGFRFTIPAAPQAVVSLTLMTDENLSLLLPSSRIRAYSRSVDDPVLSNAVAAAKPVKDRAHLDLELLLGWKPDLVLAADWSDRDPLGFLRSKGVAVYVEKTPKSWAEAKKSFSSLATALGADAAAATVLKDLARREAALAAVKAKVKTAATILEFNSFGTSMSKGTLWDDMVGLAGLKNAAGDLPVDGYGYAPVSRELLLKLDPDWLVVPSQEALVAYGQPDYLKQLQADPLYQGLRAVKQGHVLFLSEALKTTTSVAVLGAAEALQRAAYPDLR